MATLAKEKIVVAVLSIALLFILLISLFGPAKGFALVKKTVQGTLSLVPKVGLDVVPPAEIKPLPQPVQQSLEKLSGAIELALQSPDEHCFAKYGGLADLGTSEEDTTHLVFSYSAELRGTILEIKDAKGRIIQQPKVFKNMKPCIAGAGSSEFYDYFLARYQPEKCKSCYKYTTNPQEYLSIFYGGDNVLRTNLFSEDVVDSDDNLKGSMYLFKGKENAVCFLPTVSGTICRGGGPDGLDEDCLTGKSQTGALFGPEEKSIPYRIQMGALQECKPKGAFATFQSIELFAEKDASLKAHTIRQACKEIIGTDCESEDGDCDVEFKKSVPDFDLKDGCLAFLSEKELISNSCGRVKMKEGFVLPMAADEYVSLSDTSARWYHGGKGEQQAIISLIEEHAWGAQEGALLCVANSWVQCDEKTVGKELLLPSQPNIGKKFICGSGTVQDETGVAMQVYRWKEKS